VLAAMRVAGIALRPSFVPFTPWATLGDYLELLEFVAAHDLVDHVDAVQWAIRLLVPPGSMLLERPSMRPFLGSLDPAALTYPWTHPDPRMDALQREVMAIVERGTRDGADGDSVFLEIRTAAYRAAGRSSPRVLKGPVPRPRSPRLTEPWFC
jgi:hypothetical protein